ncbi:MAG TPA: DUF3159 domain-containing protein [Nocardioidaceae bacterium]|nr:DUF3159 domain-containing protein [Nocardioidaceae bacterium]
MTTTTATPLPIVAKLGGKQGIVDGAIAPATFLTTNALAGLLGATEPLTWATGLSLAVGAGIVVLRRFTGGSYKGAVRGMTGLAIALLFVSLTGQARDFFLPGIVVDATYGVVFAASVLVGRPLVGYVHAAVFRVRGWRGHARLRRVFALATLGWVLVFGVRASTQAYLYVVDQPELLGLAKVALGWPLTAVALTLTLAAVRRAERCLH